jgi:hypothetical protein
MPVQPTNMSNRPMAARRAERRARRAGPELNQYGKPITKAKAGQKREIGELSQDKLAEYFGRGGDNWQRVEVPGLGTGPDGKPLTKMARIKFNVGYLMGPGAKDAPPSAPTFSVEYDQGWDKYNEAVMAQRYHVGASARNARAATKKVSNSTFLVAPTAFAGGEATDTTEKLGAPKKLGETKKLGK